MARPTRYGRWTVSGPRGALGRTESGGYVWILEDVDGTTSEEPADPEQVIQALEDELAAVAHIRDAAEALRYALRKLDEPGR